MATEAVTADSTGTDDVDAHAPSSQVNNNSDAAKNKTSVPRLVMWVTLGLLIAQAGVIGETAATSGTNSRAERIYLDMQTLVSGMRDAADDGLFTKTGRHMGIDWLYGPGTLPGQLPFDVGVEGRPVQSMLVHNVLGSQDWDGPYLSLLTSDPWNHAYLVNIEGIVAGTRNVKVLSAGPDGILNTFPYSDNAAGDDILLDLD